MLVHCPSLGVLAKSLGRGPYGATVGALRNTATHEEHLVLVAPASVAVCAAERGLTRRSEPLRVLLLNVGALDWLDGGQWYRLLMPMLQADGGVDVTGYTTDRTRQKASTVPEALTRSLAITTQLLDGEGPEDAVAAAAAFDLAVTFTAPFVAHLGADAGREPGVRALVRAGLPVYALDYGPLPQLLDRAIAAAYGVRSRTVARTNAFRLVSRRAGEHWAGSIARYTEVEAANPGPDAEQQDVLRLAATMVLDSCRAGLAAQPFAPGEVVSITGTHGRAVHLLDGLIVDAHRHVYALASRHGRPRRIGQLLGPHAELLADFDPSWSEEDRFLWAATLKAGWKSQHGATAGAA
jgi:hypothetical protein